MRRTWIIGIAVALVVGAGMTFAWNEFSGRLPAVAPVVALAQDQTAVDAVGQTIAEAGHAAVKRAIAAVGPAVVRIDVTGKATASNPFLEFYSDPFFRRFFGDPYDEQPQERTTQSLGSGLVFAYEGEKLVLTNAHVVEAAVTIHVTDVSGGSWDASVIGTDDVLDAAVLRLEGDTSGLAAATFGDSDRVEIGDWAIAIGNPLGLSYTVTMGIISGTDRDVARPSGVGYFNNLLQTDAAINPGNSGGPLVNAFGEVVGLNTMIARSTSSGVSVEGINFAIAINGVRDILPQLVRFGEARRGWLGVQHTEITSQVAEEYGLDLGQTGTLVVRVYPGDPADRAGIQVGDVIIRVGDTPIVKADDLNRAIGLLLEGTVVEILVLREGEQTALTVTLGQRPGEAELQTYEGSAPETETEAPALGVTVAPISAAVARQLGLNSTDGVVIMDVAAGSRAERAGLAEGDVVLEVGLRPVESVADWGSAITALGEEEAVRLTVLRRGTLRFVTVE